MVDDRAPVLVGVGQVVHRADGIADALDPADLMAEAVRGAAADARLGGVPAPDSLRVVNLFSWRYGNPAGVVARRLGVEARHHGYGTVGGNSPQSMLNATAAEIQRGDLDVAILTGAEAWRTRMRAKRDGVMLGWEKDDSEPDVIGDELDMNLPAETERGIVMPVQVYPMFETAIRADAGQAVDEHRRHIAELWAAMSRVAAGNEFAWSREEFTPEQLATPTDDNRMIGLPYPKRLNSNNDVDMGAALIVCSAGAARRLGVPSDRWVFLHAGAESHEHPYISHRWEFSRTPAIEIGGQRVLELAAAGIDDIALVDLYSCFPSATQLGARSLGVGLDRPLTLTGGMAFAGGPWNSYVMHAIATMVGRLRGRPGELGLVWGNGGYVTKHSFGVYGSEPPTEGFRFDSPQKEIDALPRRQLASPVDAAGSATVEAYTVMFDRDQQPELAIASCLLADGRRAWGTSAASDLTAAMTDGEWVGAEVALDADAKLHV
ncbi:MAG: acetyl-CoA acetyltransferase [Actinomycetota bacterium]|nr:acetyl-CoA acetyltransferase [Actinomycetota bacterium]